MMSSNTLFHEADGLAEGHHPIQLPKPFGWSAREIVLEQSHIESVPFRGRSWRDTPRLSPSAPRSVLSGELRAPRSYRGPEAWDVNQKLDDTRFLACTGRRMKGGISKFQRPGKRDTEPSIQDPDQGQTLGTLERIPRIETEQRIRIQHPLRGRVDQYRKLSQHHAGI
jgi:hypothetical protein